jgi:ribosomal protein S18 acetylase RimI-like enzyme
VEPEFRDVEEHEIAEAGAVLGRAFRDAPGYAAILAHLGDARRAKAITRAKTAFTRAAVRHQRADAAWVDGKIVAVALCAEPGQWPVPLAVFANHVRGCASLSPRTVRNYLRADGYMGGKHPEEPHHYLFVLGVEPALQGRGLGKALLRRLAARADADGVPCYLETDKEANVRLYEGAGYRVLTDGQVPTIPPFRMWTMRR